MIDFAAHETISGKLIIAPAEQMLAMLAVVLPIAAFSRRRNTDNSELFDKKASDSVRGIAILLLLFGHLSFFIIENPIWLIHGGEYAVISFLFVSGFGIVKKYGFSGVGTDFLLNRLNRIFPALWIALLLIIFLDFILFAKTYPFSRLLLNFFGIIMVHDDNPSSSIWFVTMILYAYLIYFLVCRLKLSDRQKLMLLSALHGLTYILIKTFPSGHSLEIWSGYIAAFPLGALTGILVKNKRPEIEKLLRPRMQLCLIFVIALYTLSFSAKLRHVIEIESIIVPLLLLLTVSLFFSFRHENFALTFLGRYSYEIFLVHFPFMVRYDFFLFRKPFYLFLPLYIVFVSILAVAIAAGTAGVKRLLGAK